MKISPREPAWCRLSRIITVGKSKALERRKRKRMQHLIHQFCINFASVVKQCNPQTLTSYLILTIISTKIICSLFVVVTFLLWQDLIPAMTSCITVTLDLCDLYTPKMIPIFGVFCVTKILLTWVKIFSLPVTECKNFTQIWQHLKRAFVCNQSSLWEVGGEGSWWRWMVKAGSGGALDAVTTSM